METQYNDNFRVFRDINWIGMTKEHVTERMTELFNNKVTFVFQQRKTEECHRNHAEFDMENGVVVRSYWG